MKRIQVRSIDFCPVFKNGFVVSTTTDAHRYELDKFVFKISFSSYRRNKKVAFSSCEIYQPYKQMTAPKLVECIRAIWDFAVHAELNGDFRNPSYTAVTKLGFSPFLYVTDALPEYFTFTDGECLIDNHHGIYTAGILLQMAVNMGFKSALKYSDIKKATQYQFGRPLSDEKWEILVDENEEAIEFLNAFCAPECSIVWNNGDLICSSETDDETEF